MQLIEQTFASPKLIDRESMVIRGVKIIGRESVNGRSYSDKALNSLVEKYDGIQVNVDHDRKSPAGERKMSEGIGILRGIKRRDDGVYGDLHYLANHRDMPLILERAERMPESFGMSHVAQGRVIRKNGKLIVEDVDDVRSVDIVREPATTKGLFESTDTNGGYDMAIMTIREIAESVTDGTNGLTLLVEQMDAGLIAADTPVEVEPEASSDDQIKAAFRAAVIAAFDDDSLDTQATLSKIRDILKAQEKLMDKPEEPAEEEASEEEPTEETTTESLMVQLRTAEAKAMLLESGREATPERIRAVSQAEKSERTALVESWPLREQRTRPATSRPRYTDQDGNIQFPRDPKKFAASLR